MNDNNIKTPAEVMEEHNDHGYSKLLESIKKNFESYTNNSLPLFKTSCVNLFDIFINNLPENERQGYTCSACRSFINGYGNLVGIDSNGIARSVIWDENDTTDFFKIPVNAMKRAVESAKITGVFLTFDQVLGTPLTGDWRHMSVIMPTNMLCNSRYKNASQLMAEKLQDFITLKQAMLEYSLDIVDKAIMLLKSETMYRSDRILGVAEWFGSLHRNYKKAKNPNFGDNIVWLAVATAPAGFCHIKSTVIGSLLDDLSSGLNYEQVKVRFENKMNPANYMRSQSAPAEGNIKQAEKIVESLGISESLKRRFACIEEIPEFIWKNENNEPIISVEKKSIFGSIIPKNKKTSYENLSIPKKTITWEKFQRTILPSAQNIEVLVDQPNRLMALTTAVEDTAPNILQWDNTFSWYYHGGVDGEIKRRVESAGGRYENNEIRASLIWEGYTDLDLHCITPNNDHIYYSTKTDHFGGWLDVDANGGRPTTLRPVENIRWSNNAPVGKYRFYVHNYCERGNGITPFQVELEINGEIFTYSGVASSTGYKTDVFKFNYSRGQKPNISNTNTSNNKTLETWNIPANKFIKVTGITNSPNLWGKNPKPHCGNHVFFLLDGCKDLSEGKGRGFFNEMLKSELHEVRKTLEAYTANAQIEQASHASACGIGFSNNNEWNLTVRLKEQHGSVDYKIDRWD